jgi:hypothetical protein
MAVKGNQPRLNRQIKDQFRFRSHFQVDISESESGHGRSVTWTLRAIEATDAITGRWPEISWILELHSAGSRDGKPFDRSPPLLPDDPAHQPSSPAAPGEAALVD